MEYLGGGSALDLVSQTKVNDQFEDDLALNNLIYMT